MNVADAPPGVQRVIAGFLGGVALMGIGLPLREMGHLTACRVLLAAAAVAMLFAGVTGLRHRDELGEWDRQIKAAFFRLPAEAHRWFAAVWSAVAVLFGVVFLLTACFIGPARGK